MFRRRRRLNLISTLIFIGIIVGVGRVFSEVIRTVMQEAFTFFNGTNGKLIVIGAMMITIFMVTGKIWNLIAQIRQRKRRQKAIAALTPSANRDDYIIERDDYRRGNPKESYYRKTFCLYLLEVFGNSCTKCGSKENGMDIDHFIFSKNEGGSFMMKHREGYIVNNAIPLCQTCNRSKSDESYTSFFNEPELLAILEKNVLMTRRLNAKSVFDEDGRIIKQKRAA